MKLTIIVLTIVTILAAACFAKALQDRYATPTVQVSGGEVFDAGSIDGTQPVTHTFRIVNPNRFVEGISAPQPGCSCTTATASASTIPPHGTVDVTLRVDPENGNLSGSASIVTSHAHKTLETMLLVTGETLKADTVKP